MSWPVFTGLFVLAALCVRVLVLFFSPTELGPDEAQYWLWSQDLAWGYSSKPPLIAWAIAATTALGTDAEAWVRLSAPLFHAGTAVVLAALATRLATPLAGFWAAVIFTLMPGVQLSAGIMTTDAPLLFFWSVALWCYMGLRTTGRMRDAVALGGALGVACLAKYAAVYFIIGIGLDLVRHRAVRQQIPARCWLAVALLAVVVLSPNLIWNAQNGFATLAHTGDNANWGSDDRFNILQALEFIGGQFAVFGPVLLVLLAVAVWRNKDAAWLKGFIWPIVALVTLQAFISRAHANWAGVAYAAGSVLLAVQIAASARRFWPRIGIGLHLVIGALMIAFALSPVFADQVGMGKSFKRARGWAASAAVVDAQVRQDAAYTAIACDNRLVFNALAYYGRHRDWPPLRMWLKDGAHNHAERFSPLEVAQGQRVLLVSVRPDYLSEFKQDFKTLTPLGQRVIPLAPKADRKLDFYRGEGFTPPADAPRPPA